MTGADARREAVARILRARRIGTQAYKVLDRSGSGSKGLVISAIEAAMAPNGDGSPSDRADVISMSLGGPGSADDPVCQAVKSATEEGIVVCAAAGNSGPGMGTVASPGVSEDAITVGAIDSSGELAVFSSRGVYQFTSDKA